MKTIDISKFDIRLSYLTTNDIKQWNKLNRFSRTLWFENTISGPDFDYSRLSIVIFKLYPHYSTWSHVPRKNGGYLLQNNNSNSILTINADLMNGWWNILKKLSGNNLTNTKRSDTTLQLYNEFYQISDKEISTQLSIKFGHNIKVWDAFLNYLDTVYTIGNLSPAGANPGGGGLDLWTDKLLKLKQNWFDKSSSDQQPEYAPNSILDKWKPLLQQSYPSIDKNNWKNFIDNHFYLQYVDDEYELSPLTLNINEDESIVSFLDQLSGRIIERGRTIEDSINKTIEFDTIPYNSIVLK